MKRKHVTRESKNHRCRIEKHDWKALLALLDKRCYMIFCSRERKSMNEEVYRMFRHLRNMFISISSDFQHLHLLAQSVCCDSKHFQMGVERSLIPFEASSLHYGVETRTTLSAEPWNPNQIKFPVSILDWTLELFHLLRGPQHHFSRSSGRWTVNLIPTWVTC